MSLKLSIIYGMWRLRQEFCPGSLGKKQLRGDETSTLDQKGSTRWTDTLKKLKIKNPIFINSESVSAAGLSTNIKCAYSHWSRTLLSSSGSASGKPAQAGCRKRKSSNDSDSQGTATSRVGALMSSVIPREVCGDSQLVSFLSVSIKNP